MAAQAGGGSEREAQGQGAAPGRRQRACDAIAQHCRAEVFLNGYGWVPVDPADVRKVVLEENLPGEPLPIDDPKVKKARAKLFGAWEMNWLPYNYSHDVKLPQSRGAEIAYLMYPQAETANGRKDSLDSKSFTYSIKSKEI